MEESQKLRLMADMEESDSKAWSMYTASKRMEKMEYFEDVEMSEIKADFLVDSVVKFPNQFFRIVLKNGNKYDYYPKSDRLFSHLTKKWESNGLLKFKNIIGFSI
jgi:hypothetical protein